MFKKKTSAPPERRRPIVGSAQQNSAAVFSYRSATRPSEPMPVRGRNIRQVDDQNVSGAADTRRKHQNSWLQRGPRLAAVVVLAALLVCNVFVGATPHIVTVATGDPTQAYLRAPAVYTQAAQRVLASSVLNRTKLTINASKLSNDLHGQFPELALISVSVPVVGPQPVVRIEPATPVLMLAAAGKVYALDATGKALIATSEAPALAKLHLPLVDDQSGLDATPGKVALPGSTVGFITEVVAQLKLKQIAITSLTLPKGTSELDVRVDGRPYFVKFNTRGNARVEAGTYLAVKQQLEGAGTTPGGYIDVRVEGHAYYK